MSHTLHYNLVSYFFDTWQSVPLNPLPYLASLPPVTSLVTTSLFPIFVSLTSIIFYNIIDLPVIWICIGVMCNPQAVIISKLQRSQIRWRYKGTHTKAQSIKPYSTQYACTIICTPLDQICTLFFSYKIKFTTV